jgi:hypothetical protein
MLQIANDIADQTPWKVCENETCGRLFGRQQGRDAYGQNRMVGVRYCSKLCAHMQTQRAGSPVLDASGDVVGVAFALSTSDGASLAIPVSALKAFLDDPGSDTGGSCTE